MNHTNEGFLTATPNGYYGLATFNAVKAYQRAHSLPALGNVGPGTREELNKEPWADATGY